MVRLVCMFVNRFAIQLSKMVQFCPSLLKAVKTNLSKFIIPIISERFHHAMLQGFESLPFKSPNLQFLFTDSTLGCDIWSLNIK